MERFKCLDLDLDEALFLFSPRLDFADDMAASRTNPYLRDPNQPSPTNPYGPPSKHSSLDNLFPRQFLPRNTGYQPTNPYLPVALKSFPRGVGSDAGGLKPFRQTHFGRLPPELREMIYTELLASPPAFAGHNFATTSSDGRASTTAPIRYVHLKASWRQILRTCRQIYHEAHPIFFASKAYFVANPQEAVNLLDYSIFSVERTLLVNRVTAICLGDFVRTMPVYSKERLDAIFSDPNDPRNANTRQELEMETYKTIWTPGIFCLFSLKNLKTISLCFHVGLEMLYVDLLYGLTGMRRGIVEFVDASHWIIREQNPADPWSIQYACFTSGDYSQGKNNEHIPFDRRHIESEVTDIDSRAPGLKEGDERFVEISVRRPVKKGPAQGSLSSNQGDSSSADTYDDSDVVPLNQDSHETQLGATHPAVTSDESETDPLSQDLQEIETEVFPDHGEENVLTENSEHDDVSAEDGSNSNVNDDGSPIVGLDSEDSRDAQETMATHQETDHAFSQSSSEEVSGVQSSAPSSLPAESYALSRTLERLAPYVPMMTRDGRLSLLDTSDSHDQIQDETDTNNGTVHAESSQPTGNSHSEHSAETDHVQPELNVSAGEPSQNTNGTVSSSSRKQLLPEISDAPNPYTDEEMESYERWQQGSTSRTQEQNSEVFPKEIESCLSHEKKIERLVKTSPTGSTTETPAKTTSTISSQEIPAILAITCLILLLFLAMVAYLP